MIAYRSRISMMAIDLLFLTNVSPSKEETLLKVIGLSLVWSEAVRNESKIKATCKYIAI